MKGRPGSHSKLGCSAEAQWQSCHSPGAAAALLELLCQTLPNHVFLLPICLPSGGSAWMCPSIETEHSCLYFGALLVLI